MPLAERLRHQPFPGFLPLDFSQSEQQMPTRVFERLTRFEPAQERIPISALFGLGQRIQKGHWPIKNIFVKNEAVFEQTQFGALFQIQKGHQVQTTKYCAFRAVHWPSRPKGRRFFCAHFAYPASAIPALKF